METRNKAYINYEMYSCVKILLKSGATQKEVANHLKIGLSTVQRINSSESWEDYKNILAAMQIRQKESKEKKKREKALADQAKTRETEQKPIPAKAPASWMADEPLPLKKSEPEPQIIEHRQNITVQTTHFTMQKLDKIIELLTTMSAKVACIIDDLYGTKEGGETK